MHVTIKIRGQEDISFADGSNTATVEIELRNAYGPGFLKEGGLGVTSEILSTGDYEYHLANPPNLQVQGKRFNSLISFIDD